MENKISERMAKIRIKFLDRKGNPIENDDVKIEQTKHEFLFGCGAFETLAYVSEKNPKKRLVVEDRMSKWLELFNYGTLPFYWGGFEPEEGNPNTESLRKAAQFLKDKNVSVKGHPLCWHTACAPWLMNYDNKTILNKQIERIHREVGQFKGLIDMWDVINEVVIMPIYDKYDNAITRICKDLGRVGLVKEVFKASEEINPNGIFLINDFNLSTSYEILIDGCLQAGVPIKAIGLQSHQHHGIWSKEKLEETLSRFEHFGLPIHFTENTIVAGPNVPEEIVDLQDAHYNDEDTSPEYEEKQAESLEKMYRTLFQEHPLVTAITNWDYGDGAWLNAPSGVIRKDSSLKPSYECLHKLIKEEWWTKKSIKTDSNASYSIDVFKGTYKFIYKDSCVENVIINKDDTNLIVKFD